MSIQDLNNCGCCEGLSVETPVQIYNRPGLTALSYRVGDYAKFRESLLTRLSNSGLPALQNLTTRSNDDFSIALLDAWCSVADVLSFYQERIANESYLGTATEQFSILELARLIGYELRPGVAADTFLAFTMEDVPGQLLLSPTERSQAEIPPVIIDRGTKVQSTPGPGETAQTFETVEAINARPEWNAMQPRQTQPQLQLTENNIIVINGIANDIKVGDIVVLYEKKKSKRAAKRKAKKVSEKAAEKTLKKVTQVYIDTDARTTWLYFDSAVQHLSYDEPTLNNFQNISDYTTKVDLSQIVDKLFLLTWKQEDLSTVIETQGWSATELTNSFAKQVATRTVNDSIFVFRKRAAAFGYNAPKQPTYTDKKPDLPKDWAEWELNEKVDRIYLDIAYEKILSGSYLAIQKSTDTAESSEVHAIDTAEILSRTEYGMSGKTSFLTIKSEKGWWEKFEEKEKEGEEKKETLKAIRSIAIHVQSEVLPLSESPIDEDINKDTVTLSRLYLGLKPGQAVILSGERSDLPGTNGSEIKILKNVFVSGGLTILVFDEALSYSYIRKTVRINANVAPATHGETVKKEILGSGNAASSFQKFVLKQPPLTFTSGGSPSGATSTLEIRVNDILWHEVKSFFEIGPHEHVYITRQDDEAKTTVIFGDGKNGSRLPTGNNNIKATYRKGIGAAGLLKANQLAQLMTRPLGVKAATNPIKTSGAQDGEKLADARRNATLNIFTLGRIVSLQDYEDFSRAYAGIAKARATWEWLGQKRYVFLTVAGINGAAVDESLNTDLSSEIANAAIPGVPIIIASYQPRTFKVTAKVQVDPDYLPGLVFPAIEAALRDKFSFSNREFGQAVALSEVISVMQKIKGVIAVDVDELYRTDKSPGLNDRLDAAAAFKIGELLPLELLTIDPATITLNTMS